MSCSGLFQLIPAFVSVAKKHMYQYNITYINTKANHDSNVKLLSIVCK